LRTGEAVIVGEAVSLPIRTLISPPPQNQRPDSVDPKVAERLSKKDGFDDGYDGPGSWVQCRDPSDYAVVVRQWRLQNPNYLHKRDGKKTDTIIDPTQHQR